MNCIVLTSEGTVDRNKSNRIIESHQIVSHFINFHLRFSRSLIFLQGMSKLDEFQYLRNLIQAPLIEMFSCDKRGMIFATNFRNPCTRSLEDSSRPNPHGSLLNQPKTEQNTPQRIIAPFFIARIRRKNISLQVESVIHRKATTSLQRNSTLLKFVPESKFVHRMLSRNTTEVFVCAFSEYSYEGNTNKRLGLSSDTAAAQGGRAPSPSIKSLSRWPRRVRPGNARLNTPRPGHSSPAENQVEFHPSFPSTRPSYWAHYF